MRLIDADSVIEFYKKQAKDGGFYAPIYEGVCNIIGRFPTIDAVPVVRCRECKYHKPIDYCTKHKQTGWFDDDFCS